MASNSIEHKPQKIHYKSFAIIFHKPITAHLISKITLPTNFLKQCNNDNIKNILWRVNF